MNNFYRFSARFLRVRWVLMVLLGGLISFYQLAKHGLDDLRNFEFELMFELAVMGFVLPVVGGYLLTKVETSRANSARYVKHLEQFKDLFQQLAQHRDLSELMKFLVQYPATILPVQETSLYLYDHRLARLELAENWNVRNQLNATSLNAAPQLCRACLSAFKTPMHSSTSCPFVTNTNCDQDLNEFCLALSYNKILIGTLRMTCDVGQSLTPEQMEFMNFVVPEIALALAMAIANPRQIAHVRLQTQLMERQQTAIDLHNALAQQVGFLHLNLDRLANDSRLEMNDDVRNEVESMRITAAEIYQQVRNTLALLLSWESVDFTQAIVDYSFKVAQRAHLSTRFTTAGYTVQLPAEMRRQVFSIFQEALNNIEKYAGAQHIQISVIWSSDSLIVGVEDDGVGFDSSSVTTEGHYGLTMMRELVKTMHGHLEINSCPGQGTALTIKIPLPCAQGGPISAESWPVQSYALIDSSPPAE